MSIQNEETVFLNPNINTLFGALKNKLDKYDSKILTLVDIIQNVVEVVELTKLQGSTKKKFALSLVEKSIEYLPESRNELKENILQNINNGLISDTIDLIIKASKQELKINSISDVIKSDYFKKLVLSCIGMCSKR